MTVAAEASSRSTMASSPPHRGQDRFSSFPRPERRRRSLGYGRCRRGVAAASLRVRVIILSISFPTGSGTAAAHRAAALVRPVAAIGSIGRGERALLAAMPLADTSLGSTRRQVTPNLIEFAKSRSDATPQRRRRDIASINCGLDPLRDNDFRLSPIGRFDFNSASPDFLGGAKRGRVDWCSTGAGIGGSCWG